MGKGSSRNRQYFNDSSLRRGARTLAYGNQKSNDSVLVNGGSLPMDREKCDNYDWIETPLGKVFMATIGKLYFTYFTTFGRTMNKKAKEMEHANQLEKELQEESVMEESLNV